MLGKLLKHEWKATARLLLPLNLGLILLTIIGRIILAIPILKNESFKFLTVMLTSIYVFTLIALVITTFIYLIVRFYKNLYGDEGYLMHTLPVSSYSLLNAKLLIAGFWLILSTILCIISVIVLLSENTFSSDFTLTEAEKIEFFNTTGFSFHGFLGFVALICVISIPSSLLQIYTSISIGQLFEKHKILSAVGAYFVMNIIMQTISTIFLLLFNFDSLQVLLSSGNDSSAIPNSGAIYHSTMTSSIVISFIYIAIFYFVTAYIMRKKVNLD